MRGAPSHNLPGTASDTESIVHFDSISRKGSVRRDFDIPLSHLTMPSTQLRTHVERYVFSLITLKRQIGISVHRTRLCWPSTVQPYQSRYALYVRIWPTRRPCVRVNTQERVPSLPACTQLSALLY
jgi:hypothetical protein